MEQPLVILKQLSNGYAIVGDDEGRLSLVTAEAADQIRPSSLRCVTIPREHSCFYVPIGTEAEPERELIEITERTVSGHVIKCGFGPRSQMWAVPATAERIGWKASARPIEEGSFEHTIRQAVNLALQEATRQNPDKRSG